MTDKLMAKTAHVVRRGAVYYFRLRVPADLLEHYGKNEITFSLKTKDPTEAKLKAAAEGLRLQGEFSVIRKARDANLVESMSPEEIRKASLAFAHAVLSDDEDHRMSGNIPEGHRAAIEELEHHARPTIAGNGNYDGGTGRRWMKRIVRNQLEDHGIQVAPDGDLENRLVYAFSRAAVEAVDAIKERDRGRVIPTPEPVSLSALRATTGHLSQGDILLSTLVERYAQEQEQAGNWQEKTSQENRAIYRVLVEIVGDVPVSTLGYPALRDYKAALLKLPANMNKDKRYREKPIAEILSLPEVEPMSTTTINKHLIRASSLLDWAMKHGYAEKNFADGLTVAQRKRASEERSMFESEHLQAIFKAIAQGKATRSGKAHSFHYWMPLLGYFTGSRVNELASLRPQDFSIIDDVPCITISQQNDGGKGTKTEAGNRIIPLHPELIRLGLLRYVQHVEQAGQSRLFPELKLTKNGYGDKVSKWFSGHNAKEDGFLWRAGITEDKLSFHSFRHTVTTLLERAGLEPVLIKRIMGHALDDVTFGRYSKGSTQDQHREAMIKAIPTAPVSQLAMFEDWSAAIY